MWEGDVPPPVQRTKLKGICELKTGKTPNLNSFTNDKGGSFVCNGGNSQVGGGGDEYL